MPVPRRTRGRLCAGAEASAKPFDLVRAAAQCAHVLRAGVICPPHGRLASLDVSLKQPRRTIGKPSCSKMCACVARARPSCILSRSRGAVAESWRRHAFLLTFSCLDGHASDVGSAEHASLSVLPLPPGRQQGTPDSSTKTSGRTTARSGRTSRGGTPLRRCQTRCRCVADECWFRAAFPPNSKSGIRRALGSLYRPTRMVI